MNTHTDHPRDDARTLPRRRVYLGEGLTFEIESRDAWLRGRGDRPHPRGPRARGGPRDRRHDAGGGRGRHRPLHRPRGLRRSGSGPWCATSAACRPAAGRSRGSGSRSCPTRPGRRRRSPRGVRYPCPEALPAFAAAACPWFFRETLHFRIVAVGAGGMTLRTTHANPPLLPRAELDFELHLRVDRASRTAAGG